MGGGRGGEAAERGELGQRERGEQSDDFMVAVSLEFGDGDFGGLDQRDEGGRSGGGNQLSGGVDPTAWTTGSAGNNCDRSKRSFK